MFLVWLEAKRIQGYLQASPALRHMVGASELVERACTELARAGAKAFGGELLQGAAGKAWLSFEDRAKGEAFLQAWPALLDGFAPGLLVAAAGDEYLQQASWEERQAALRRLQDRLRAVANAPPLPAYEFSPLVERAPTTGGAAYRRGRRERLLDLPTAAAEGLAQASGERLAKQLETPTGYEWPTEFAQVAGATGERGELAVVHADGNSLGQTLHLLHRTTQGKDPLETRLAFSQAIGKASIAAARRAAKEVLYPHAENGRLPARPLVLGGDDLTCVVRGQLAGPFVRAYLESFEAESEAALKETGLAPEGTRLTACAGVALVKANFPFLQAYELAETLCSWAKERARAARRDPEGGRVPSAMAFHRSTASLVGDYGECLEKELSAASGVVLARGPYALARRPNEHSLPSLDDLERLAGALRALPRGSVRSVVGELRESLESARARWERALRVADRQAARTARTALQDLTGASSFEEVRESPLLDALTWARLRPDPRSPATAPQEATA